MEDRVKFIFSKTFQIKLLAVLMKDNEFIARISDILKSNYFESEAMQWLAEIILEYHKKYNKKITIEVIANKYKELDKKNKILVSDVLDDIKKYWKSDDDEYIKDEVVKFCKNQGIKDAIYKSVELVKDEDYDGIKQLMDDALLAGERRDLGRNYVKDLSIRYDVTERRVIPTPWAPINDLTNGGLGKGELGIVVGGSGMGKTWLLCALGAQALKEGKKVIHYTLELSADYTGMRYDSLFTRIPFQELKYHQEKIQKNIEPYKDNLIIKWYPTDTITVNALYAHLKALELSAFKPDLIIVDYGDNLLDRNASRNANSYVLSGNIYNSLRGLAGTMEAPLWTASQAGRVSEEVRVLEGRHIAESYKKVMVGDFLMSISRKIKDKESGRGRVYIIKNRFGPDGLVHQCKMNAAIGDLHIAEKGSGEEFELKEEEENGRDHDNIIAERVGQFVKFNNTNNGK